MKTTNLRKILLIMAVIMLLVVTVFTVTGCSDDSADSLGNKKENSSEIAETEKEAEKEPGKAEDNSYGHKELMEYIKEEGEYDAEEKEYSISEIAGEFFLELEYETEDDVITISCFHITTEGYAQFELVDSAQEYTFANMITLDDGTTSATQCIVKAGARNLKSNYDQYITVDWVNVGDTFIEDYMDDDMIETIKSSSATMITSMIALVDSEILDGTGFSISEIYDLPTE